MYFFINIFIIFDTEENAFTFEILFALRVKFYEKKLNFPSGEFK